MSFCFQSFDLRNTPVRRENFHLSCRGSHRAQEGRFFYPFAVGGGVGVSPRNFLNKRPKGPHIVHLSTMCHLLYRLGRAAIFVSSSTWKKNCVEDIEILLPVRFRWIPFSSFRGEVENVLANQRPGRPSCFSDWPEKHKLGRGRWDLASCQVSLNYVLRFQRRSQKCLSQSETEAGVVKYYF